MSLNLTYVDDTSRIVVAADGLGEFPVRVDWSLNATHWETARGGASIVPDGGAIELSHWEFLDAESHYRVVPAHPGLYLPGAGGDHASTPDHAALDITGDLRLRAWAALDDWADGTVQTLIAKFNTAGDARAYQLIVDASGTLTLHWSPNGEDVVGATSTVPVPFALGLAAVEADLDVDNGNGGWTVVFRVAASLAGPWSQLGVERTGTGTTSIANTNAALTIGGRNAGTANMAKGTVLAARVYDSTDTLVAAPDFTAQPAGTGGFVDEAGRSWTIHGNAVLTGQLLEQGSITPELGDEVWLVNIKHPSLNRRITVQTWANITRDPRDGLFAPKGRSAVTSTHDVRGPRQWVLTIATDDIFPGVATSAVDQAAELDLILASGHVFFLRIPKSRAGMPGGYVRIGRTSEDRIVRKGDWVTRVFDLPCTMATPPGPDVVGGPMTYQALMKQFGSYTAVAAANSTYQALMALMADPEDFVVF